MGFDDLSDDDKKQLLANMKIGNGTDDSSASPAPDASQTDPSQPNITTPGQYISQGLNYYDTNVANRPRAAALAMLKGDNPIQAGIDNKPTSGEDIATEAFKTLAPDTSPTNAPGTAPKAGMALAAAVPLAGMAVSGALDPLNFVPGGAEAKGLAGAAEIADKLPLAERATASFLSKTGEAAPSFKNAAAQAASIQDQINQLAPIARRADYFTPEVAQANNKLQKLQEILAKYNTQTK